MDQLAIAIRRATERDQQAIRALVHSERLNPTGLNWPNFLVAAIGGRIIGAVQMRKHSDGSRELGSLVVSQEARGYGIASRLIDAMLAEDHEPVWMITAEPYAGAYARWGFEPIETRMAPTKVRRNHFMGSLARIVSFFKRRPMRRLVILERRTEPQIVKGGRSAMQEMRQAGDTARIGWRSKTVAAQCPTGGGFCEAFPTAAISNMSPHALFHLLLEKSEERGHASRGKTSHEPGLDQ